MPKPCRNVDCENTVSDASGLEFCFTCTGKVKHDYAELEHELDRKLADEALFVAYCEEHGLPHPHE